MAVKTETQEKQTKEITFPCLMRSTDSGLIVLFYSENSGTVIIGGSNWVVGEFSNQWITPYSSQHWELSPPVTISNA